MSKPRLKGEGAYRILVLARACSEGQPAPLDTAVQNTVDVMVELGLLLWANPSKPHVRHGVRLTAEGLVKLGQVEVLRQSGLWPTSHNRRANEKWNFLCNRADEELVAEAVSQGWPVGHDPALEVREALKFDADHQMWMGGIPYQKMGYVAQDSAHKQIAAARRGAGGWSALKGNSRTSGWAGQGKGKGSL